MLLVKSKESKSSNKFFTSRARHSLALLCFLFLQPFVAFAQSAPPEKIGSADTLVSVLTSLLVVIGVIVALGFLMRRFNIANSSGSQMQVVSSMMAGARERIVVIQVGKEQHLLGITAHNINHLARLEHLIEKEPSNDIIGSAMRTRFQQILQKQQHKEENQADEHHKN